MKILVKIIDFSTLTLGIFLALDIVLKSLGASAQAPFVRWLYFDVVNPLLAPFIGIFPSPEIGTKGIIDIPAFFALVIYMALGYALSMGIESLGRNVKPGRLIQKKPKPEPENTAPLHPQQ